MADVTTPPTGVLIGRYTTHSPEWHAARALGIGGSEIAAILGLSKWESRFSLWHRKAGNLPPQSASTQMDAGTRLEPVIAAAFLDKHPHLRARAGGTFHHAQRTWQRANPDLLLAAQCGHALDELCDEACEAIPVTAILEAKYAVNADARDWGEPGTDEIPAYYRPQCQWYLDVTGVDTCYVEAFFGGRGEFRTYVVHADPADQAMMRTQARTFLGELHAGVLPDIDAHTATYDALRQLHPDVEDIDVEVPADLAEAYAAACAQQRAAETAKALAVNQLLAAMGTARHAVSGGQRVATRSVHDRTGIDLTRLRADHPDVATAYATTTTVTSLRPSTRRHP